MRYKVEFLSEPTEASSVCFTADAATFEAAAIIALTQKHWAWVSHGATGFQIRNSRGRIMALEDYNIPAQRPN